MRTRRARFVWLICLTTVLAAAAAPLANASPILWNRLGSNDQILSSSYGPNLGLYVGGVWPDVAGNAGYVPGVFGDALTVGAGAYGSQDRVHTVVWDNVNQHLNPDRGTIEVWYRQSQNPVPFEHGVYRIFDGSYGLGSGVTFNSEYLQSQNAAMLVFGLELGGTFTSVQHDITAHNGSWIHLAGVWDRDGIDGSVDKLRLYLDGNLVAANTGAGWGNIVGQRAGIGGGNDGGIAGKFALDNLKVYDAALTDFSHRFDESWIPEPSSSAAAMLALSLLGLARRR